MIRYRAQQHGAPVTIGDLRRARQRSHSPIARIVHGLGRSGLLQALAAVALIVAMIGLILLVRTV